MTPIVIAAGLLLGMLSLTGCGAAPVEGVPTSSSTHSTSTANPEIPASASAPSDATSMDNETQDQAETGKDRGAAEALVELAMARLAAKYGFDVGEISVLSVTLMDWPDTSLGCPRAGEVYAQVITPGYIILLEHDVTVYSFHTDRDAQVILCEERPPDNIFIEP